MDTYSQVKVIIVEGTSDKRKVQEIIKEPIEIICTNGTISSNRLEEWIEMFSERDMYILVDADESGEKLRNQLIREFPNAENLYIDRMYREVESAPNFHLAAILLKANIDVHTHYLDRSQDLNDK